MIERICWIVLALMHFSPTLGFFMPSLLSRLYGVEAGSELALLLQHRAALFGIVLLACIWAAISPDISKIAVIIVGISMLSFLALYLLGGTPQSLRSIAIADLIGVPFLLFLGWRVFHNA